MKNYEIHISKTHVLHFWATQLWRSMSSPPPPPLPPGFLPILVNTLHQFLLPGRSNRRGLKRQYFAVYAMISSYGILRNTRWLKWSLWHLLVLVVPRTFPDVTAATTVITSTCGRPRVRTDVCILLMCVCVPSREVSPVSACFLFPADGNVSRVFSLSSSQL